MERLMYRFHDLGIFYQLLAVLFIMPGNACICYGTEIAMEGDRAGHARSACVVYHACCAAGWALCCAGQRKHHGA